MIESIKQQIRDERRWHLRCDFIFTFHILMGEMKEGIRGDKWRVEDTAKELNLSVGYISESIKLAKALRKNDKLKYFSRENALNYLREES